MGNLSLEEANKKHSHFCAYVQMVIGGLDPMLRKVAHDISRCSFLAAITETASASRLVNLRPREIVSDPPPRPNQVTHQLATALDLHSESRIVTGDDKVNLSCPDNNSCPQFLCKHVALILKICLLYRMDLHSSGEDAERLGPKLDRGHIYKVLEKLSGHMSGRLLSHQCRLLSPSSILVPLLFEQASILLFGARWWPYGRSENRIVTARSD
eukprot:4422837-Amphidinium_carterae.1